MEKRFVQKHHQLEVYKIAFEASMRIFELTKDFPVEEQYSLTSQFRKSSRSVCANIAEGWRKRRYQAHFVSKLSDAEAEAAETQTWIQFSVGCKYLSRHEAQQLYKVYENLIGKLVRMIHNPKPWLV